MKAKKLFLAGALACSTLTAPMVTMLNATPVFAEVTPTNGTIVNTTNRSYDYYQIFKGTQATGSAVLGDIEWGTGVNLVKTIGEGENAKTLVQAIQDIDLLADGATTKPFTGKNTPAEIADVLSKNSAVAKQFATVVEKYLADSADGTIEAKTGDADVTKTVGSGYYLLVDTTNPLPTGEAKNLSLLQVTNGTMHITDKTGKPTSEKKVEDEIGNTTNKRFGDTADHEIGEEFRFKLTAKIPDDNDFDAYKKYKLVFHDTLSKGLKYKGGMEVKVYHPVTSDGTNPDEVKTLEASDYVSTASTETNNGAAATDFTVTINDIIPLLKDGWTLKNTRVEVIYNAELTTDAIVDNSAFHQDNTFYLEFSNNPNAGGEGDTGRTTDDKSFVGTYTVDNYKYTMGENNQKVDLAGAEFILKSEMSGKYALVTENTNTDPKNGPVGGWKVTGWTNNESEAGKIVSRTDGKFAVHGLDAGTYKLKETKAPAGYNLLQDEITVEITATHKEDQEVSNISDVTPSVSFKQNNADATRIEVQNNQGSTLPETGGMGTTMLYTAGGVLVAGAALFFVTNKRMKKEED